MEPSTIDIFSMNSIAFYFVKLFRLKRQPFQTLQAQHCEQIANKKDGKSIDAPMKLEYLKRHRYMREFTCFIVSMNFLLELMQFIER